MAFDYEKIKRKEEEGGQWASYSDLFMLLSFIFLLLYIVSALNNGTAGVQKNIELKEMQDRTQELEQQIKVYNALKEEKLEKQDAGEQAAYEELMSQLDLLQEKADFEKEDLKRRSQEQAVKERALNKYQQMVKNIINANILAKGQIQTREKIIDRTSETLKIKQLEISSLIENVESQKSEIRKNNVTIKNVEESLKEKIKTLNKTASKSSELKKKIAVLKQRSQEKVNRLESKNRDIENKLAVTKSSLSDIKEQKEQEKKALSAKLSSAQNNFKAEVSKLQSEFQSELAQEKSELESKIKTEKLNATERAIALAKFRRESNNKQKALESKISSLDSDVKKSNNELEKAKVEKDRALASIQGLKQSQRDLSKDLAQAKDLIDARKGLTDKIVKNLKAQNIDALVDKKTGDVILSFGKEYFDEGKADLKPSMKKRLKKFMPIYTASLLGDEKTSKFIDSVELIGFASPTYNGKYVNPDSLKSEDQAAVNYNLKLSFNRANSIFKYIFDKRKMDYPYQKDLLPKVKVVGRGYLPSGKTGADIPKGLPKNKFCKLYGCKKAQRVIVKFSLKND